jgi:hypothetical protein
MNDKVTIKPLSPFDQAEKICSELVKQLKDSEFRSLLDKYNEEFTAAKPTNELTDDDLQAIEGAKADAAQDQALEYARGLFKIAIEWKKGDPESELFKQAKKGLEIVREIKKGNLSWEYLQTVIDIFIPLCRAECEEPEEIDSQQCKFGFHPKT